MKIEVSAKEIYQKLVDMHRPDRKPYIGTKGIEILDDLNKSPKKEIKIEKE